MSHQLIRIKSALVLGGLVHVPVHRPVLTAPVPRVLLAILVELTEVAVLGRPDERGCERAADPWARLDDLVPVMRRTHVWQTTRLDDVARSHDIRCGLRQPDN